MNRKFRIAVLAGLLLLAVCLCAMAEPLPEGSAPAIPEGSELTAQEIRFTGGKQYEVYSAPSGDSLRGGSGKAKVSTNGWIQVFGREGDWILIQYSIDSGRCRFGYIDAAALPEDTDVPELDFCGISAVADCPVSVTDDPLCSQSQLTVLSAGDEVTWLATMGDWAYIGGASFRGFVPVSALAFPEDEEEGYDVFTGSNGEIYDLFEIRKMFYDQDHRVYAVSGVWSRVVEDDDCYGSETADAGTFTYALAPDFRADMVDPETGDIAGPFVPVTGDGLYAWYIGAYLCGEEPEGRDLVFQYDLPEDEQETAEVDFWFVTTRIRLNGDNEVEYMRYYYVPWA